MALRSTLIILFVCVSLLNHIRITGAGTLSRDEDLELEKELARLNKPAITTIQTIHGEIYDCVDFYQQPAFDNPLLKRHKFKPQGYSRSEDDPIIREFRKIWTNGKGCPTGSVPIKRTTKDDLIRGRLASELYSSRFNPQTSDQPGLHYAGLRTIPGLQSYKGGSMSTGIYQPPVVGDQHSASRMKLQNNLDTIEAGWMVNPTLFNDNLSRFYIYTHVGETRCFNTLCNIFVGSSPSVPIGAFFPNISKSGGPTYILAVSIQKNENGNWDLMVGRTDYLIGWWPIPAASVLSGLSAYIEWGGQVFSHPDVATPPMGAGLHFLKGTTDTDAFCADVVYTSCWDPSMSNLHGLSLDWGWLGDRRSGNF